MVQRQNLHKPKKCPFEFILCAFVNLSKATGCEANNVEFRKVGEKRNFIFTQTQFGPYKMYIKSGQIVKCTWRIICNIWEEYFLITGRSSDLLMYHLII